MVRVRLLLDKQVYAGGAQAWGIDPDVSTVVEVAFDAPFYAHSIAVPRKEHMRAYEVPLHPRPHPFLSIGCVCVLQACGGSATRLGVGFSHMRQSFTLPATSSAGNALRRAASADAVVRARARAIWADLISAALRLVRSPTART